MEGATVGETLRKSPYALDVDVAGLALAAAATGTRGRVGVHLREHAREELRLFFWSEFWGCVCIYMYEFCFLGGGEMRGVGVNLWRFVV